MAIVSSQEWQRHQVGWPVVFLGRIAQVPVSRPPLPAPIYDGAVGQCDGMEYRPRNAVLPALGKITPWWLWFAGHSDLRKRVLESFRSNDRIMPVDSEGYRKDGEAKDSLDQDTNLTLMNQSYLWILTAIAIFVIVPAAWHSNKVRQRMRKIQ